MPSQLAGQAGGDVQVLIAVTRQSESQLRAVWLECLLMSTEKLSAVDRIAETTHMICKWAEQRLASGKPLTSSESAALEQISRELRKTAKNLRELLAQSDGD